MCCVVQVLKTEKCLHSRVWDAQVKVQDARPGKEIIGALWAKTLCRRQLAGARWRLAGPFSLWPDRKIKIPFASLIGSKKLHPCVRARVTEITAPLSSARCPTSTSHPSKRKPHHRRILTSPRRDNCSCFGRVLPSYFHPRDRLSRPRAAGWTTAPVNWFASV